MDHRPLDINKPDYKNITVPDYSKKGDLLVALFISTFPSSIL